MVGGEEQVAGARSRFRIQEPGFRGKDSGGRRAAAGARAMLNYEL